MKKFYKYFTLEELEDILAEDNILEKASKLIEILFKGRVDNAGAPYLEHLYGVAKRLEGESLELRTAGLLHDTLEDIEDVTEYDLLDIGFPYRVIELVKGVTNDFFCYQNMKKQEIYHNKITKIIESRDIELIKLKYADMSDNLSETRLNKLKERNKNYLINKYSKEIVRLREAINK